MNSGFGFREVRFSLLGRGLVRLSLLGHGLVRLSLLGMDWCRSFSQGIVWGGTISLKAWIEAGLSLLEAGQSLFGIGQSQHVSDVLSLNSGYLSLCTLSAGPV